MEKAVLSLCKDTSDKECGSKTSESGGWTRAERQWAPPKSKTLQAKYPDENLPLI
jgi:hypothetical protein